MEIKTIDAQDLVCFKCKKNKAVARITMSLDNEGKLQVCLCHKCLKMGEIELYAHFMQ